ncbi:Spc7 kinetochore protein-domain-containing protein [Spinellus fusiger]|nr:Spc7 kinetochore protein-domain-containing protein [Spinellus fusiger]
MEEIFNNDIPELSESPVGEEPVPTLPVNFPGFLDYVGLYFNNEVPVNVKSPLTSFDLEQVTPATLIEKAFAAVSTLPQLTVYNKIYDDMKAIETESSEKMKIHYENDPQCQQLIREYFEGDTDLRCNMIKRLKQLKQYCDIKARYIVQEQHNKRLRELHKKLRENLDRAERDTGYVDEANRYIDTHMPMFDDYRLKLANAVKECRKREDEYNSVNHEAQALLEDEIESQRSAMNLFRKEYNDLTSAEFESREKIEQIKQKKAEVMESISRAIICRDENKGPTKKDVEDAEDRLKRLSSLMCIKFNQRSNKITDITMSDDIHVVIDMIKLKNRESEAVTVQLIEERKSTYEEFSELLCGIDSVIENEYDDIKIMRNIWFYWHRIRAVRYEIFLTRWRFFTKLTRLTDVSSEPLRNTKERGVVVETTAFSYMANAKFLLLLQFQPRDMYLYPLLDMSKVEIVVKFGDIPVNEIRTLLAQKEHSISIALLFNCYKYHVSR